MPSGTLGKQALSSATYATVYECPTGAVATVNVHMVNRATDSTLVRLAIGGSGTPTSDDFIEYDAELAGRGVLLREKLVLSAGDKIVARSGSANVTVRVDGFEDPA